MKHRLLFSFLVCSISAIILISDTGCANILPPEGGPRDTLPPVLVAANPPDSTVNFQGNRITLTFDEYINDLQNQSENILFTPLFKKPSVISVRLRTITVKINDTLQPNTTYVFSFGNAIADYNETNVLRDFRYVFSTGPSIDTGTLSGQVLLAETGKIDSTLQVVLHPNLDDSAILKEQPRYAARLDGQGRFRFTHLPPRSFRLYALGNAGLLRMYTDPTELFAFQDSALTIGQAGPQTLYAFRAEKPRQRTSAPPPGNIRGNTAAERRLRYATNVQGGQQHLSDDLVLTFGLPLRTFDSTGVRLTRDSVFTPVPFTMELDTSRTRLRIRTDWAEKTRYNLVLAQTFATDTMDRALLKSDTVTLTTLARSDYGTLLLRFRNLENIENPVVQFIQNDQVVFSGPIGNGQFAHPLFKPGDYELRILSDANGNGQWDPGSFPENKRQPERVHLIEARLNVRQNFQNEKEIAL